MGVNRADSSSHMYDEDDSDLGERPLLGLDEAEDEADDELLGLELAAEAEDSAQLAAKFSSVIETDEDLKEPDTARVILHVDLDAFYAQVCCLLFAALLV